MDFICENCGKTFSVSDATLGKYPGWTPKTCYACKKAKGGVSACEENLTTSEVLEKYHAGPVNGVFTDGGCEPNPGPGGWGAVYVKDNEIIAEATGHEPDTTNNRMELSALIAAAGLVPAGTPVTVYSDSQLCVSTVNEWARGWAAKGWRRKGGEIKNLDLVQEVYRIYSSRPELKLVWVKAHAGNRWNEYADSLACSWKRKSG
jgi:ribonuclease HI